MTILITGATGFIGRELANELEKLGQPIRCLIRSEANRSAFDSTKIECRLEKWEEGSLPQSLFQGVKVIYHLAGLTCANEPTDFQRVNVSLTEVILKSIAALKQPPVFIFASSIAAGGPAHPDQIAREECNNHPISNYGKSKRNAELIVNRFKDTVPSIIFRIPIVIGPSDKGLRPLFRLIRYNIHPVIKSIQTPMSMIFIRDLVNLLILAKDQEQLIGNTFYVKGFDIKAIDSLFSVAFELKKVRPLRISIPHFTLRFAFTFSNHTSKIFRQTSFLNLDKWNEINQRNWTVSSQKHIEYTGFKPQFDLRKTLETMLSFKKPN